MTLTQIALGALALSAYYTSNVFALPILEVEPNDNVPMAQNINAFFSTEFSPDIGDITGANTSTTIPHVSISGFGDYANGAFNTNDFFKFTVNAGSTGIFDIDYGTNSGFDSRLQLYTAEGVLLAENDLFDPPTAGAGGSGNPRDPFIQYDFAAPGDYLIAARDSLPTSRASPGQNYVLQVSIRNQPVAVGVPDAGSTISLMGIGMLGVAGLRRMLALAK